MKIQNCNRSELCLRLSGQKFIKSAKMVQSGEQLSAKQCYQTGYIISIGQKYFENAKAKVTKSHVTFWVIFKHCEFGWFSSTVSPNDKGLRTHMQTFVGIFVTFFLVIHNPIHYPFGIFFRKTFFCDFFFGFFGKYLPRFSFFGHDLVVFCLLFLSILLRFNWPQFLFESIYFCQCLFVDF